ncbi:uncharacterized protein ACNS7B_018340 [Menidia menidia]
MNCYKMIFCSSLAFCLLLFPFAGAEEPVKAPRQNVLSFLNDAFSRTTQETILAKVTAHSNTPKAVKEQDSEDLSEEKSTESLDTSEVSDAFEDLESHEAVVCEAKALPSTRTAEMDQDQILLLGGTINHDQQSDQKDEGGKGMKPDIDSHTTHLRREAAPGRVEGMNDRMYRNRETLDQESLEDRSSRLAAVGNSNPADYGESGELTNSEMNPFEPRSFSAPGNLRAA